MFKKEKISPIMRDSRGDKIFRFFNGLFLGLLALIVLYPVYFIIIASFSDPDAVLAGKVVLLPVGINLEGYYKIMERTDVWQGYKFTVDTGGIISEFSNICENKSFPNHISNDVRMLVDTVKMLRHYMDHNNHPANGYIEKNRIAECQKWILKHAGTGIPETQEDFANLNHELDRIAQQLLKYSKEMILFAIDHPDSNTVNRWQAYILSWYSNPAHFDVYQGYLIDVYLSKASTKRPQVKNLPLYKLQQKTNRWISSRVDQLDQNIRDQKTKIATVKMNLKRLPQEQRKQAVSIISEFESQLELMEKEYEPYYRKDSDVNIFKRELKTQLQTTIQLLEEKGETFSLLPQDLIPKDIARIFKDVPSPDNDFM